MNTASLLRATALGALVCFSGLAGAQYGTPMKSGSGCYWLFQGDRKPEAIKDFDLVRETARPGLVEMPSAPSDVAAVSCYRDSPVPEPHDYEALLRGYPLFLWVPGSGETTVVALGVDDGQFKVGVTQGSIDDDQRTRIVERLEGFYESYNELESAE